MKSLKLSSYILSFVSMGEIRSDPMVNHPIRSNSTLHMMIIPNIVVNTPLLMPKVIYIVETIHVRSEQSIFFRSYRLQTGIINVTRLYVLQY